MKALIAAATLMTLAAGPSMADLQTSFAACAKRTGKDYAEARDAFLKAAPAETAKPFLREKLKSDAWQDQLAAHILLGWEDHREEYRGLLAEPKLTNQQGAAHYPWALGREGVKAADVPLLVELLTKGLSPGATWDAARALVGLAQARPDTPLDVHLLHRVLRSADTPTEDRKAVAWVLGSLPAKYQDVGELKESLKAELARKDRDRGVTESLLDGFGRAAEALKDREKDALVRDLRSLDGLREVIGQVPLTYAVGSIGGDEASKVVAAYLDRTRDELEKRWALHTLSKSKSLVGTDALLAYADDARPSLKDEAIEGLARVPYTRAVAAKLGALARKAPDAEVHKVLRTLETISARHKGDKDVQAQVRSQVLEIRARHPESQKLKDQIRKILHAMQEPKP